MPKPQFTEAEVKKIRAMADELKEKIENAFSREVSDVEMAEIKSIRQHLEQIGFIVTVDYNLDATTIKLMADVTLWWPKEVN